MKNLFKISFALLVLLLAICVPVTVGAIQESPVQDSPTHTVTFYDRGDPIAHCEVRDGDTLTDFPLPTCEGYKLLGWREGGADGALFEPTSPITADTSLYAAYELLPPSFDISSLSFTYDGAAHTLGFSSVEHPLLDGGVLSYEWYRDGASLGAYGSSLSLKNVAQSGEYSCRLVFSVGGDVAEITTPPVRVSISKSEIPLPVIPPLYYTGDAQTPPLYDNGYYTVDRSAHTVAGTYPVALTLTDSDNFSFPGTDKPVAHVDMLILPAENFWVVPPTVSDIYTSFSPSPSAMPRFGTPVFLYSRDGVEYTPNPPTLPGKYLMRAEVAQSENYSALISEPIPFFVIAEDVVGIAVKAPADKMTYRAFEAFDPTGILVGVTYNSGRYEEIGADSLSVSYQQADSFRYRDSGVIITYGGSSVLLRTTVLRADYDLSGISFPDTVTTYSGTVISPTYTGLLPIGLDGIPLTATVTGGGTDVGQYTVTVTFNTASDNYNNPQPMTAALTVLPYNVTVEWSELSFVYDGTMKLPKAHYVDHYGRKITLTPTGARSFAGQYTATVTTTDPNYSLDNPTVTFEILKADYDLSGAVWQGGGETYDGAEKNVKLVGLPLGITVIGYVNGSATEAGQYTATAALSYDTANYNAPTVADFTWRILPAEYSTDGYAFFDTTAVYDGEAHYPIFEGKMPIGIDGIALEYSFSSFATHVSDGHVRVEVVFATKSTNYTVPKTLIRYVEITPREITVQWKNVEFRYTGAPLLPSATADECKISVCGASVDVGEYTATAISENLDYKVVNDTCPFVILKADNTWISPLSVPDVFFGRTPTPTATVLAGEVNYTYFSDAECTEKLDSIPSSVGIYYVVAHSPGDKNHEPITSPAVSFEIIAIIPVALEVELDRAEFTALEQVIFTAALLNNDGSYTAVDSSLVTVLYEKGDSLRFGDATVEFSYGDLCVSAPVTVIKRNYDMSGATWSPSSLVFDGKAHSVTLSGLPDGVTVREYIGNGFIYAGQYSVSAALDYDTLNYNAPTLAPHTVTVEKQTVPLPVIGAAEYDGTPHTAALQPSALYTAGALPTASITGAYPIILTLTDPNNYTFGTSHTATVYFRIEPRRLTVKVSDFDLYLFEREVSPAFRITDGTLVAGDTLTPVFRIADDKIFVDFDTDSYDITVIPGTIYRHKTLSDRASSILLFIILIILLLLLVVVVFFVTRRRVACRVYHPKRDDTDGDDLPPPPPTPDDPVGAMHESPAYEPPDDVLPDDEPTATIVDAEYADAAITNDLARDLIRRDEDVVTEGKRHGIVNVDTLSRSFSAGDRVDINSLKSHSLIPYDTAYIKVLARGIIDKPLYVYANDFSLSAVKMIALSGGKAVKVNSVIKNK